MTLQHRTTYQDAEYRAMHKGRKWLPNSITVGYINKHGDENDIRIVGLCFAKLKNKEITQVEFNARIRSLWKKVYAKVKNDQKTLPLR